MKEAKFYKQLLPTPASPASQGDQGRQARDKNIIQCQRCNHFCSIKPNQTGTCNTQLNKDGKLYSLVYGYPAAINVDPIEKKPFYHFMPDSFSFSLGTYGCNFKCTNCQNWDMSQAKNIKDKVKQVEFIEPEKIVEEALGHNCQSIAYTYNEPTVFTEYALDIMKLAREQKLKNVWVSNGFMSKDCLEAILPYLNAINIDLKSMDEEFYKNNCEARLAPILENLKTIKREQVHLEVTTLIIPTLSDDLSMLTKLANFIVTELDDDTPWHISKFSPEISWKLKNIPATGDDMIYQAYEIGKDAGLKYVYVGNLPGDQKENTYCPKCNELAIQRMGYYIERLDNKGRCAKCDRSLDIVE